jgi:hypothetical protein
MCKQKAFQALKPWKTFISVFTRLLRNRQHLSYTDIIDIRNVIS